MTNHLFNKRPIPPGRKSVLETCIHCGQNSHRYAGYARVYIDKKPCTGPQRDIAAESQKLAERIAKLEAKLEKLKGRLEGMKLQTTQKKEQ